MATQVEAAMSGWVTFRNGEGQELRGTLRRLQANLAVFDWFSPEPGLRMSEVLNPLSLSCYERTVYSGKAVVTNLIQSGPCTTCEVGLIDNWMDAGTLVPTSSSGEIQAGFEDFLRRWGRNYRLLPEFKVVIADIHSFLLDLRNWLENVELSIRSSPAEKRSSIERRYLEALTPSTTAAVGDLYERFDEVARKVEPELVPAHQAFGRRHLHPLILAAPFVYRTLQKPLGYAGDYEMVNMMMRDPLEGASLFAKAFNVCALSRPPIVAHRNRLEYLTGKLLEETARNLHRNRNVRILNVGCGPAHEIRLFLGRHHCSDRAEFTLVDFDSETLDHVGRALTNCKAAYRRSTRVETVKRSVQQMLKQSVRAGHVQPSQRYDFVYCAGLFDYLPDSICKSLVSYFYELLEPGGLLLVTNVDNHPSRNEMEYFLDWHLIYRDTEAMRALIPAQISAEWALIAREPSGVNIFLEIRKPPRE